MDAGVLGAGNMWVARHTNFESRYNLKLMSFSKSLSQPFPRQIPRVLDRPLFILLALWGGLIVWIAPHPPMVDLPQHAGQVALLRDMLSGNSKWFSLFRINPATPYLIGYGLALPLSYLMPISAAIKLLISLSY